MLASESEKKMKRVLIESPFAGDVESNIAYARRCVLDCVKRGEAPYASHLFFTQPGILDDEKAEERALGIEAGLAWGAAAERVVVYVERGISAGMRYGIARAKGRGQSVEIRAIDREVSEEERREVEGHHV